MTSNFNPSFFPFGSTTSSSSESPVNLPEIMDSLETRSNPINKLVKKSFHCVVATIAVLSSSAIGAEVTNEKTPVPILTVERTSGEGLLLSAFNENELELNNKFEELTPVMALRELRLTTGLSIEQLARMMAVSRRTYHLWMNGGAIAKSNEEHIYRLLEVIRKIDCGSTAATRALLLMPQKAGAMIFDLLAQGDFDAALKNAGTGPGRGRRLKEGAAYLRDVPKRPPITSYLDAVSDIVHIDTGEVKTKRSIKADENEQLGE